MSFFLYPTVFVYEISLELKLKIYLETIFIGIFYICLLKKFLHLDHHNYLDLDLVATPT